jgi:hypothetical protein
VRRWYLRSSYSAGGPVGAPLFLFSLVSFLPAFNGRLSVLPQDVLPSYVFRFLPSDRFCATGLPS